MRNFSDNVSDEAPRAIGRWRCSLSTRVKARSVLPKRGHRGSRVHASRAPASARLTGQSPPLFRRIRVQSHDFTYLGEMMYRSLGAVALLTIAIAAPVRDAAAQDPVGGAILAGAAGAILARWSIGRRAWDSSEPSEIDCGHKDGFAFDVSWLRRDIDDVNGLFRLNDAAKGGSRTRSLWSALPKLCKRGRYADHCGGLDSLTFETE